MAKKKSETSTSTPSEMSFEASEELRKVKKALSQARKFQNKAEDTGESSSVVSGATGAVKKLTIEKKNIERREKRKQKLRNIRKSLVSGEFTAFKKKFLTRPTAKGPRPISARKTLKQFAHGTDRLVREVPERVIEQDNRSQFFKREFAEEQAGVNKWLS